MDDNRGSNRGTIGCGVFFVLFALYLLWPILSMILSALFYAVRDVWPQMRIPLIIVTAAFALWVFFKRLLYGRKMSYESIQELVWKTGERYARQQGVRPTAARNRRWEAPGYTVSDFIDRYGISPQMDRELIREYKRAFRR